MMEDKYGLLTNYKQIFMSECVRASTMFINVPGEIHDSSLIIFTSYIILHAFIRSNRTFKYCCQMLCMFILLFVSNSKAAAHAWCYNHCNQ